MIRLGIDLGGTKTEIAAIDAIGDILLRHRVATPKGDYRATVEMIVALVGQAEQQLGINNVTVGIGIPGAISLKTGRVKNANSTWLIGEDLLGDLQAALNRPVRIANDANCFALSETLYGSAKGASSVFGVIIGTGCGGGLVVDGKVLNGVNSIAGEWGHNPLPWKKSDEAEVRCYCGQHDCIETFLSGSGLAHRFELDYHQAWNSQTLVQKMRDGDSQAIDMMNRYYDWLAQGLASVINVFDPDVIVLGGGLSQISELYQNVPARWSQWVFSDQVQTRLLAPMLGDSSGVIGAAGLWHKD